MAPAFVDLVNDHVDARQQFLEHVDRPFFERFRHHRVIRVGNGVGGHAPGIVPGHPFLVDQDPHQFGNDDHRMRIVDVNGDLFVKIDHGLVELLVSPDDALQSRRHHEVLLFQAQHPPLVTGVVRVQDFGNRLDRPAILHGFDIVVGRIRPLVGVQRHHFRAPEPQRVHRVVVIAGHRHIIRNGQHFLVSFVVEDALVFDVLLPDLAAELDGHRLVRPPKFPDVAVLQPRVRQFRLVAVDDLLPEHAIAVADTAAVSRNVQGSHRVQKTGGQPAESAAAKSGLGLLFGQVFQADPQIAQPLLALRQNIQVEQIGQQNASLQVFDRKIIHLLAVPFHIFTVCPRPAPGDQIADQTGQRLIAFPVGPQFDPFPVNALELLQILGDEFPFTLKHGNPPPLLVDIRRRIPVPISSRSNPFSSPSSSKCSSAFYRGKRHRPAASHATCRGR